MKQKVKVLTFPRETVPLHPIRLTALIYLRETLQAEMYEECASIVAVAKEFGACDEEIESILNLA